MLFKKPAPPAPKQSRSYAWPQDELASQSFWVSVYDWQYKVLPSRKSRAFGTWMFQFEGKCTDAPLEGLVMAGSVEVLEAGEQLGMFEDYWKQPPSDIEGYCFLMESGDKSMPPSLGATLYCQSSALEWIHRAFSVASQSRSGGLGIELRVDCPNNDGGSFWREQWRTERLRITSWQLFSGAQLKPGPQG